MLDALQSAAFTVGDAPVSWLEFVAALLGLAMVACNLRVHPAAWPLAIASSALYAIVFWGSRLYGQVALQGLFIAVAAWGWWQWLHGRGTDGAVLRVGSLDGRSRLRVAGATLLAWPAVAALVALGAEGASPWLDALTTVCAITGQLLLARKRTDNWPVWLGVNALSVVLFAQAGLWPTVLLYALFAALAAVGWRTWLRLERQPAPESA